MWFLAGPPTTRVETRWLISNRIQRKSARHFGRLDGSLPFAQLLVRRRAPKSKTRAASVSAPANYFPQAGTASLRRLVRISSESGSTMASSATCPSGRLLLSVAAIFSTSFRAKVAPASRCPKRHFSRYPRIRNLPVTPRLAQWLKKPAGRGSG